MADVTGTNGNDFLFFNGTMQQFSATIINPYSGQAISIDEEKNVNSSSYEGLAGFDTLLMSNVGDVLFADSSVDASSAGTSAAMLILSSVERIIAGEGGDVIVTASTNFDLGDTIIEGGGADDIIWSNVGDDELFGREGDDIIDGGPGNDILNGGDDNDVLSGGADADLLNGEKGDDTLMFESDFTFDNIYYGVNVGSPGIDGSGTWKMVGGTNGSLDTFNGGDGFDTIEMTSGNDAFFLQNPYYDAHADSTVFRIVDVEQINAGDGDDIVDLTDNTLEYGDIIINGGDGNDYLWSSVGNDTLDGGNGTDNLWGGIGNDILLGGDGNDIVIGGPDRDSGAIETTTLDYTFSSDVIFPDLIERTDIHDLAPPRDDALGIAAGDLSVNYKTTATITFQFTGAGYNNSLGFYSIASDGTIQSTVMAFTNVKDYNPGDSVTVDLPGTPDTDFGFFIVSNGDNKNNGYNKMDLDNGEFRFVYKYGKGDERDANITDAEKDVKLVFYGNDGSEEVVVGSNNHIYHTTDRGGATNLNSDDAVHVVSGLVDENDTGTLRIGFEDLKNLGDADYNDVVFDLEIEAQTTETLLVNDNDVLYGGAGDDVIDGGVGNDVLIGGLGNDELRGGHGKDMFVFDVLDGMLDTIEDFELGIDSLNITDILSGFDPLSDAISDFVQLTQGISGTELSVNADGDIGGSFDTVAVVETGLDGASLADLINAGSLITDQSFVL
jgi:Ca2+-binding RTX toxin-like protein